MVKLFSEDIEEKLLGLIFKEPNLFSQIRGRLTINDFYINENQIIFDEMVKAKEEGRDLTEYGLIDFLENYAIKDRRGWDLYISKLIASSGFKTRIEEYIDILKDKSTKRNLEIALKNGLTDITKEHSPIEDLITKIEGKILDVTKERELKDFSPIDEVATEYSTKLEEIKENEYYEGIQTGFKSLDNILGGFKKGDLSVIAARPSMGKTAFALEIAKNVAKNYNVAFFSIEMPREQLIQRMISSEAMLSFKDVKKFNSLSQDKQNAFEISLEAIKKMKMWIDDSPEGLIHQLTWKARKLNDLVAIDLIIIDYLQLLTTESRRENRQQQVSDISRALKQLARELKVPVIAISQLSRGVEGRQDKKPLMSDIRESGAIEQDADSILMLFRENYYKNEQTLGSIEELQVNVAKNRNGPTGTISLNIDLEVGKIKDRGGY